MINFTIAVAVCIAVAIALLLVQCTAPRRHL